MKEPQSKGDKEGVLQQVIDRRNDEISSLREQLSNMMAVVASVERERDEHLEALAIARESGFQTGKKMGQYNSTITVEFENDDWKMLRITELEKELAAMTKERDANAAYFEAYHQLRVAVNAVYPQDPYQLAEDVPALMQAQLAATEALCRQYREALKLCKFDSMNMTLDDFKRISEIFALPSPTTALNNAIAEELEKMAKVFEKQGWPFGADDLTYRAKELREMK